MAKAKTTKKEANTKTSKLLSRSKLDHFNGYAVLFFGISFALIATLSVIGTMAAKPTSARATPNLSVAPTSQSVGAGTTLTVEVWEDSGDKTVNAVQANISYPIDKFNFVSIDSSGTAFGVDAQAVGGNGKITIARGSTTPITGKQLVAKVKLTPLSGSRKKSTAVISFDKGSALLSDTSNSDILAATYNGSYTL
jgi:hypothetical protein